MGKVESDVIPRGMETNWCWFICWSLASIPLRWEISHRDKSACWGKGRERSLYLLSRLSCGWYTVLKWGELDKKRPVGSTRQDLNVDFNLDINVWTEGFSVLECNVYFLLKLSRLTWEWLVTLSGDLNCHMDENFLGQAQEKTCWWSGRRRQAVNLFWLDKVQPLINKRRPQVVKAKQESNHGCSSSGNCSCWNECIRTRENTDSCGQGGGPGGSGTAPCRQTLTI